MWIGGRKGRAGGNPQNVKRHAGDLPAGPESGSGGYGRRNLYAMLLAGAGAGQAGAHIPQPNVPVWKNRLAGGGGPGGIEAPMAPPPDFPPYIAVDSHLCYLSKTGKTMEVVVEKISVPKGEVKVTFAEDPKVWKMIPISLITSKENPLLGAWGAVPEGKEEAAREAMAAAGSGARKRSRSPRR
eukprot:TRINITY_DN51230_c0_g1_i1.p1 TRINITY_DN51230_c0_g1~~TRINITY_DN51230_c0_g1_i1.p1  ORF type:complete len:184 (-),score=43.37 TRINITY_DN51230_c0_g1_i1:174-725(-)